MISFKPFYLALGYKRRQAFKRQVMIRTGWSNSTFYYKCDNDNMNKLEQEVLSEIMTRFCNEIISRNRKLNRTRLHI